MTINQRDHIQFIIQVYPLSNQESQPYIIVHDTQGKNSRTGLVKVSNISNNRLRHSDARIAWLIFHKISQMYIDIREQESEEAIELIINIPSKPNSNNTSFSSPITPKISIQKPTINIDLETVPKELK